MLIGNKSKSKLTTFNRQLHQRIVNRWGKKKLTKMLWYKLENKKPIATESGAWDGLRSDKILVATRRQTIHIATMYDGVIDGIEFRTFYDDRDFEIENVIMWAEIDNPF